MNDSNKNKEEKKEKLKNIEAEAKIRRVDIIDEVISKKKKKKLNKKEKIKAKVSIVKKAIYQNISLISEIYKKWSIVFFLNIIVMISVFTLNYIVHQIEKTQLDLRNNTANGGDISLIKTYFGDSILIDKSDVIHATNLIQKGYEDSSISYAIYGIVHRNDLVIDLGASFGYYTLYLSRLVGENGVVYSIEGRENIFKLLDGSISINKLKNISLYNKLVYRKSGLFMVDSTAFNEHNLINIFDDDKARRNVINMQFFALDDILPKVTNIKLLLISIDRNSQRLLIGASNIISRSPNIKIIIHVNDKSDKAEYIETLTLLKNMGFSFWVIKDLGAISPLNDPNAIVNDGPKNILIAKDLNDVNLNII